MEQPIKILEPMKRMPFTLAVALRLLVLAPIFGISVFMIISGYLNFLNGNQFELYTIIVGIIFFIIALFLLIHLFFLKKRKLAQLQYLFYSNRLVIFNHKAKYIVQELPFNNFPPFTFHENLNNFGYITIGIEEPLIARGGLFNLQFGVNMKDSDIMLENLPEVKKEYLFLKELITEANSK